MRMGTRLAGGVWFRPGNYWRLEGFLGLSGMVKLRPKVKNGAEQEFVTGVRQNRHNCLQKVLD